MSDSPSGLVCGFTEAELRTNKVLQEDWYHTIEILPGLFTKGRRHRNLALTRALLRHCQIENMNCLDVGAMDCLITILMKRRGAATVIAQDVLPSTSHVDFLKKALGVEFDYVCGNLADLGSIAKQRGFPLFDVIVFSGVLYHMLDPFTGLALMRGLLRTGGLFLIETTAAVDRTMAAYFNANGRFLPHTNYWQVSLECLDYMLRFLRLAPLDCVHFLRSKQSPLPMCRIAVVCRAVQDAVAGQDDEWMMRISEDQVVKTFLDSEALRIGSSDVKYSENGHDLIFREDSGTVNLYETVCARKQSVIDDVDARLGLKLDAKF